MAHPWPMTWQSPQRGGAGQSTAALHWSDAHQQAGRMESEDGTRIGTALTSDPRFGASFLERQVTWPGFLFPICKIRVSQLPSQCRTGLG